MEINAGQIGQLIDRSNNFEITQSGFQAMLENAWAINAYGEILNSFRGKKEEIIANIQKRYLSFLGLKRIHPAFQEALFFSLRTLVTLGFSGQQIKSMLPNFEEGQEMFARSARNFEKIREMGGGDVFYPIVCPFLHRDHFIRRTVSNGKLRLENGISCSDFLEGLYIGLYGKPIVALVPFKYERFMGRSRINNCHHFIEDNSLGKLNFGANALTILFYLFGLMDYFRSVGHDQNGHIVIQAFDTRNSVGYGFYMYKNQIKVKKVPENDAARVPLIMINDREL